MSSKQILHYLEDQKLAFWDKPVERDDFLIIFQELGAIDSRCLLQEQTIFVFFQVMHDKQQQYITIEGIQTLVFDYILKQKKEDISDSPVQRQSRVSRVGRASRLSRLSRSSLRNRNSLGSRENQGIETDVITMDTLNDFKYVFHLADQDRSGAVHIDEFCDKLGSVPYASRIPKKEVYNVLSKIQTEDGYIKYIEFSQLISNMESMMIQRFSIVQHEQEEQQRDGDKPMFNLDENDDQLSYNRQSGATSNGRVSDGSEQPGYTKKYIVQEFAQDFYDQIIRLMDSIMQHTKKTENTQIKECIQLTTAFYSQTENLHKKYNKRVGELEEKEMQQDYANSRLKFLENEVKKLTQYSLQLENENNELINDLDSLEQETYQLNRENNDLKEKNQYVMDIETKYSMVLKQQNFYQEKYEKANTHYEKQVKNNLQLWEQYEELQREMEHLKQSLSQSQDASFSKIQESNQDMQMNADSDKEVLFKELQLLTEELNKSEQRALKAEQSSQELSQKLSELRKDFQDLKTQYLMISNEKDNIRMSILNQTHKRINNSIGSRSRPSFNRVSLNRQSMNNELPEIPESRSSFGFVPQISLSQFENQFFSIIKPSEEPIVENTLENQTQGGQQQLENEKDKHMNQAEQVKQPEHPPVIYEEYESVFLPSQNEAQEGGGETQQQELRQSDVGDSLNDTEIEKDFSKFWDNYINQSVIGPRKDGNNASVKAEVQYQSLIFDEQKLFAQDYLNIREKQEVVQMLQQFKDEENLVDLRCFSEQVFRIGKKGDREQRIIMVTYQQIYILIPKTLKLHKHVQIEKLFRITNSEQSANHCVLHFKDDFDYMIETYRRTDLNMFLIEIFRERQLKAFSIVFIQSQDFNIKIKGQKQTEKIKTGTKENISAMYKDSLKTGWLEQYKDGMLWTSGWKQYFFVLTNLGFLVFKEPGQTKPSNFISIVSATLVPRPQGQDKQFCFKIIYDNGDKQYFLAAQSKSDFDEWIQVIRNLISSNNEKEDQQLQQEQNQLLNTQSPVGRRSVSNIK